MNHKICGNCLQFQSLSGCEKFPELQTRFSSTTCKDFEPLWLNFPEGTQSREDQIAFLRTELPIIQQDKTLTLYFGSDPFFKEHAVYQPGVGIRYMNTAGGHQYRLFLINVFGQEHASSYHHDIEELITAAIVATARYMRPLRSNIPFQKNRTDGGNSSWYRRQAGSLSNTVDANSVIKRVVEDSGLKFGTDELFCKAETITLKLPE